MAVSKCLPVCILLLLFLTEAACQSFVPSILGRAWSPWNDILQDPFHILEENPLSALGADIDQVSLARVDWKETPESHIIKIDVPGIKKEDIKIEFKSGVLTVSGERMVKTDKSEQWHRAERLTGKFIRQFRLTDGDMAGIKASLENGVLVVNVPKVEKKGGEVQVISIESGDGDGKNEEL